jgi:ABC-type transport system involved in cytochrome c biogenesis permease component
MRRPWGIVGLAVTAELLALALWALLGWYEALFWPLVLLSLLAGLAGAWFVLATMFDLTFHRPRGERLRPLRGFDLALGCGLFILAFLQLRDALGQLPA